MRCASGGRRNQIKDTSGSSKLFRGIDTDSAHASALSPIALSNSTVTNATEGFGNGLNLKHSSNIVASTNVLDADGHRCVVATDVQGVTITGNTITVNNPMGTAVRST